MLPYWSPKCCEKPTAQTPLFHLKISWMCLSFCCKMHSIWHYHPPLMPHDGATFHLASLQIKYNKHSVWCFSCIPCVASIFLFLDIPLLSVLFVNLARLVLLNMLLWNCHNRCWKWSLRLLSFDRWRHFIYTVNRYVQNKTTLKCVRNHANLLKV